MEDVVVVVAAVIAASGSMATVALGLAQRRTEHRRRLTDLAELTSEIGASIRWGSSSALTREVAQAALRTRLGNASLPATRELAYASLANDEESARYVAAAGAELDRELGISARPPSPAANAR